ncbi:topoisomerase II-associated protein PAT1 [Obelidium mucronatum]|nr:topoisomerase II-associated protein PAT1 [Obelidium mucronatum]
MSFFGFDATLPGKGPRAAAGSAGGVDDDELGEGSRLDELLEEKFKYGLELGDGDDDDADGLALLEEDAELNDETFGGDAAGAGADFDFAAGASAAFAGNSFFAAPAPDARGARPNAASPKSPSQSSRPVSQPADPWNSQPKPQQPAKLAQQSTSSAPKMMSLEEIEAQMMANRSQPQQHLQQQQFQLNPNVHVHHQPLFNQPQQHFSGYPPQGSQQFQHGAGAEKRIMSVTELEESMLRDKQQQRQQHPFPPQNLMGPAQPYQQFQGPPGFQGFPQQMGGPNMPQNMGQFGQMGMPPHLMGPMPPGSPGNMHARPGFGMGPPPPGMILQQGPPPMGGPMLQNQIFSQGGPGPQFGNFQGSPRSGNNLGALPLESPQGQPGSPLPTTGNNLQRPVLQQDEMLRNAQELAQQQHQMQQHQQQQQQQNQPRSGGRGDYGQMRYNNAQAQNNRKNVLLHTGFSNDENRQRGATGKGPGPLDGGWSHQSNRTPRWVRYADSMTQYEKETIARIQISQLVSENPYRDDFYYQIYSQFRSGNGSIGTSGANWQQSMLHAKDSSFEMQAQMKKLIEGKKLKPKGTTLAMEGALGKISLTSVKNPRKLIQINQAAKQEHAVPTFSRLTRRKILKSIETVYTCVLNIEQLKRKVPERGSEGEEEWAAELEQNIAEMWEELSLSENIPFTLPHPFPYFLSYSKGKRVFPRLIPYLTPDQMFSALTTLFSRAESLDVCNMPAGSKDEAIDLFVTTVVPPLVSFISEVPLQVVNAFMRILLERHNMVWLAKSKAGLAFLALLLSRAEILKQGGGSQQGLRAPGADDLSLWAELYNFLFASLQGNFAAIFPPSSDTDVRKGHDEVYIWQFLAAMAVGATSADHQRILLTEVRDKIFETSRRGSSSDDPDDARALANVNLFLNALGLGIDASQLASM